MAKALAMLTAMGVILGIIANMKTIVEWISPPALAKPVAETAASHVEAVLFYRAEVPLPPIQGEGDRRAAIGGTVRYQSGIVTVLFENVI